MDIGNPLSKPSGNAGNPRVLRQYISTYLFQKSQMREPQAIQLPEIMCPFQILLPSQMKVINIIVPISLGRSETIHRFLRIWNNLFKQDRNQRLIFSFSGSDSKNSYEISWRSLKNIVATELSEESMTAFKIIFCTYPFNRAPCIQSGIDILKPRQFHTLV